MSIECVDATGEKLSLDVPARRVVSLVPSETETVFSVGCGASLVGRTQYCVEPRALISAIDVVGGTKDASVEAIIALHPDLVLANQEENTREMILALRNRGIRVHTSFPKTVEDAVTLIHDIARMLGVDSTADPSIVAMELHLREAERRRASVSPVRVFCPIWMDPLMTIHRDTFISDMIDLAGGANIFADRTRRYPLAADLGLRAPLPPERVRDRDVRYPRVTLDEVVERAPDVILLPDEPHPFTAADAEVFRRLDIPAARNQRIHFIDGKDVCWYSPRMGEGVQRLANVFARG